MAYLRLFIALEVHDEVLKKNLNDIQSFIPRKGFKLVDPDKIHLTLHFLGDVDEGKISELQNMLDSLEYPTFELLFKNIGVFPKPAHPKVIWIGISMFDETLQSIHGFLKERLNSKGFRTENRPYSPHLTIARVKFLKPEDKNIIKDLMSKYQGREFASITFNEVSLIQSTLTPQGAIYKKLYGKKLV